MYSIRIAVICGLLAAIFAMAAAGDDAAPYRVGPEDVINITVARHTEFSGEYLVPPDGTLNLSTAGRIDVTGKTLDDIAAEIAGNLNSRIKDPEVTVTLKTARPQRVYVIGAVAKPGSYDAKPGWRITEAVAAAGGLTVGVEASECTVSIISAGAGRRISCVLSDVMSGNPDTNASVTGGDVIAVEVQETMPVYVIGKVKTPGLYKLQKGNTGIIEALTVAGGTLDDAAIDRVTVTHLDGTTETVDLTPAIIQGKQEAKMRLQPGDLVTVPEETAKFAVLGYVNEPGFFPMKTGQPLTLYEALGMAKGIENKRGELGAVAVIRTTDGKQERMVVDLKKFLKSGDSENNPLLKAGDIVYVPQTSKPDWDFITRTLTAVAFMVNPFVK